MLIPYLIVRDAKAALDFYCQAFGAEISFEPVIDDQNRVGHSEITLPDGQKVMLADEHPEHQILAPSAGGPEQMFVFQTSDLNAIAGSLEAKGAQVISAVGDDGHGGRAGRFRDPFGYVWIVSDGA
ncbi:MAG: VOC family protein [Paracoccaceae bacterium]|nr:VOC family protein [Paracoccaceae bacterium]